MSDYPRFEVYRKAIHGSNDSRVSRGEDIPPYEIPFDSHRSPFPSPRKYDFDTLEEAKEVMKTDASAADLMLSDYYILKVTEDTVEVAYGDPTVTAGGEER
ncbi:MAG: hypothetical protein ABEJ85_03175 [Haloarculaceae archaeon]